MSIIRQGLLSADLDVPVVLPTLNLDFANSQSLDKRITFSRGSIGTRVNRNGLIETIAANQPRFDFDPISGECKGLMIEESRTNLVTNSEDFTNANWSKSQSSIITTSIVAPNGSTAYKLVENTVSGVGHFITQVSITKLSNAILTLTIFAKAAERQYLGLVINSSSTGFPNRYGAEFNLGNGTASEHDPAQSSYTNGSYLITPYSNGWYRCRITCTTSTDAQSQVRIFTFRDTNQWTSAASYAGDGTSGLYIWGAQVEAGAFPTSYIPTTTSAVTRSADLVEMTGTNFSSWYNQSEGTIVAKSFIPTNSIYSGTFRSLVQFIKSSTYNSDSIFLLINSIVSSAIESKSSSLRSISFNQSTYSSGNISAISYKEKYYTLSTKGLFPTSSLSGALPSGIDKMIIGNVGDNNPLGCANGTISRIAYYPKALSPAELQYLTQ